MARNALLAAVAMVTVAAITQHKTQLIAESAAQSWSCPFQSRHIAQWDKIEGGFVNRMTQEVEDELPAGCTVEKRPRAVVSLLSSRFLERKADPARPNLIPYPKSLQLTKSAEPFVVSKGTTITLGSTLKETEPYVFAALLGLRKRLKKFTGDVIDRSLVGSSKIELDIISHTGDTSKIDPAGYKLTVTKGGIKLEANGPEGFSYGVTTLGQLLPLDDTHTIAAMVIEDAPVLKWRGLMLDVSRHFFTADQVKKLITVMAEHKMNSLHWHLTDDQGWRLPVPGYPKLILNPGSPKDDDGSPRVLSKGAYTEQDIIDVVAFAKARHIRVTPEVDVPGHMAAAILAYPELGNTDQPPPDGSQFEWGIHEWTLAPTKTSLKFLDAVFGQVAKLFPDAEYIHTGGDEAPMEQWIKASKARKTWEAIDGLAGGVGTSVARYFNGKFREIIHSKGKKMAGWDEVQHVPGLPVDVGIFAWNSEEEVVEAATNGRHVINCNIEELYFDHGIPMGPNHYGYNLVPSEIPQDKKHLVLGAQGQLWSEHMPTWQQVEFMAWPKGIELAENLWSSPSTATNRPELTYQDFIKRLQTRKKELDEWGVNTENYQNVGT